MRKITLKLGFFIVSTALLLSGCNKDDDSIQMYGDTFVRSVMVDGAVAYGVIQNVVSTSAIDTATVTCAEGILGLKRYDVSRLSYYNEPALGEYESLPPSAGTYSYNVKFTDGREITTSNSITPPFVLPAQNVQVSYVVVDSTPKIKLVWDAVDNVDAYTIKVTSGSTVIYTTTGTIDEGEDGELLYPIAIFSAYTPGTVDFEIMAVDYESTSYNINSISVATTSLQLD